MIFFDTETCGLHGMCVLIQYAEDDGEIKLFSPWTEQVRETLELIEWMCEHEGGVCGFNLAFDWFHIAKLYTTFSLIEDKNAYPEDMIDEIAILEEQARTKGACVNPQTAMDLMLHARKGPYQSLMNRKDIRIRRVPVQLAEELILELDKRVPLKDVYFARYADPTQRWKSHEIKDDMDDIIPEFRDLVLKFAPSSALKALAQDALNIDTEKLKLFHEIEVDKDLRPKELGYAPFALAIGKPGKWKWAWPEVIHHHINHWKYNGPAREYASDDVKYTRGLYDYFKKPEAGDVDSILACAIGAMRWRGYPIDLVGLRNLREGSQLKLAKLGFNFNSPVVCKRYLADVMSEMEQLALRQGTGGIILEDIEEWKQGDVCDDCKGQGCKNCDEGFVESDLPHPAALRAGIILDARHAKKEIELFDKLLLAGRFHASFKVIGTKSDRMSGADGLNPQGIRRTKEVRCNFTFAEEGEVLTGGDFDGYEVTLMDAAYGDPELRKELQSGKKIHALFGTFLYPGKSYDDIRATDGLPDGKDLYEKSKRSVFAIAYGGNEFTIKQRIGISEEQAGEAYRMWCKKYKVWGQEREKIFDMFCSMRQPNGIGTRVEWHEPEPYIESLVGFKRYFTLENQICKTLFELAEDPPDEWQALDIKVVRRDRVQTGCGAVRSALFAAAFAIQASNMRAAANHVIQSTGGSLNKMLQTRIWEIQPKGIHRWHVAPYNGHDEIQCPTLPQNVSKVRSTVLNFVSEYKKLVPLLSITWKDKLNSWADK